MSDTAETADQADAAFTGSGAPSPDDEPFGDHTDLTEVDEVDEDGHPEPKVLGMMRQDNVSEPGVQKTTYIDGTESAHGDAVVADDEDDVEDVEAGGATLD